MSGIYIHIPFCKQACSYCDFYFVTRQGLRVEFVNRLCEEIACHQDTSFVDEPVDTIYLGGGTPSLLKINEIEKIFRSLEKTFKLQAEEVTMEINPDDVTPEYLSNLRAAGITRASMGVQSFDAGRLAFMNRVHTPAEAEQALNCLRSAGFTTFTVDLIYGNPGQTTRDLEKDVDRLLEFDPPHISAYSLTIEPGTRLGKSLELGRLTPADDEVVSEHFDLLSRKLPAHGIRRYEISNYSRPGFEAVHNTRYWNHRNYLGLGPSSHSFWWDQKADAKRWKLDGDIKKYLSEPFNELMIESETLPCGQLAEERLMLGLRTVGGVTSKELADRYGYSFNSSQKEWLGRKQEERLLSFDEDIIRLSDEGLKMTDYLVVELLRRGNATGINPFSSC